MLRGPMAKFSDNKHEITAAWASMRVLAAREGDEKTFMWRPFSPDNSTMEVHADFSTGGINAVALDSRGQDAFAGRSDGNIACLDLASNRVWRHVDGVSGVTCLAANGEHMKAVRGSTRGILDVWDLNEGGSGKGLRGHTDDIKCIEVDWKGNRAVTGALDSQLIVWNLATTSEQVSLTGHEAGVLSLAVNWDKDLILSGSQDETLKLWSLRDNTKLVGTLEGHSEAVTYVDADWDKMRALSISEAG